jgi:hypothetical protein
MQRHVLPAPTSFTKATRLLLLTALVTACSGGATGGPAPTIVPVAPSRPSPTAARAAPPTALPATPFQGQARLTILYTNDTRGYVDPCG